MLLMLRVQLVGAVLEKFTLRVTLVAMMVQVRGEYGCGRMSKGRAFLRGTSARISQLQVGLESGP